MTVKDMIKKEVDNLPENLAAEVYDFMMFLEGKREKSILAQASQSLSAPSFQKVWDNKEDTVYDSL